MNRYKTLIRFFAVIYFAILNVIYVAVDTFAATYYMPDNFPNLRVAVAGMSGGDTLIIRDGTYSGTNNWLWQFTTVPSGTAEQFTTIKAENDGQAIFPDGFIHMEGGPIQTAYVSFEGIKSLQDTKVFNFDHVKFLRCAFTYNNESGQSASAPLWLGTGCNYILVEDCWAWGAGRYRFVVGGHHNVFRRCVARYDRGDWTDPMTQFSSYGGHYIAFQNCIAIDSDHEEFWLNTSEIAGTFYVHHGSTYNSIKGCLSVNVHNPWLTGSPGVGLEIRNNLAIDVDNNTGVNIRADNWDAGAYSFENCTVINISGIGLNPWGGENGSVSAINNVLYGIGGMAMKYTNLNGSSQGYNVLYNNAMDFGQGAYSVATDYCAANSNAIDPIDGIPGNGTPAILYPVRVESGSNLKGTGLGGADRGANILYRIGKSGTFYGELGWDTVTTESLWPWPYEDRIRNDMKSYSYSGLTTTGVTSTLSGNRGFCADGKQLNGKDERTLTSYIWEYLGNKMPDDIYGVDSKQPGQPSRLRILSTQSSPAG